MASRRAGASAGTIGRTTSGPGPAGLAAPGPQSRGSSAGPAPGRPGAAAGPRRGGAGHRMKPRRASRHSNRRQEVTASSPVGRVHRNRRATSRASASRVSPGRASMSR